jgi:hypothetical protein
MLKKKKIASHRGGLSLPVYVSFLGLQYFLFWPDGFQTRILNLMTQTPFS